jgi:hypothetical protein
MKHMIKKIVKSIKKKGVRCYMNKEKEMFETRVEATKDFYSDENMPIKVGASIIISGIGIGLCLISAGIVGKRLKTA